MPASDIQYNIASYHVGDRPVTATSSRTNNEVKDGETACVYVLAAVCEKTVCRIFITFATWVKSHMITDIFQGPPWHGSELSE